MSWLEHRLPPPVIALAALLFMWGAAQATPAWRLDLPLRWPLAIVLALAGVAIALAGVLQFRRLRTTVNPHHPERASALAQDGVYRWTRNPMYLGMAAVLAGAAVYFAHPVAPLLVVAFAAYIDRFQIRPEERALATRFGAAYAAYCGRVRRWI